MKKQLQSLVLARAQPNVIGTWCKQDLMLLGPAATTQQPFRPYVRGYTDPLA